MASGVQSVYPQLPPTYPSHPTHGHSNSMSDSSYSQPLPPIPNYNGSSQPMSTTPGPTPVQPRPSPQNSGYGLNGQMLPPISYAGYPEPNLFAQQQHQFSASTNTNSPIYTAVYSNVSVFEMEVNGVAVMRRRADGWLNATQILKVAGVEKGKRTKVLEKEILTGQHEKVQGGYGKYQGTWISYQRGREFCRQYGVEQLLQPLLDYDLGVDGQPGQQILDTPTKEQAMAAQRKKLYGGMENPYNHPAAKSNSGTFFKNMSSTAANAINALNRTRVDSPGRGMDGRRSAGPRRPSSQSYSQDMPFPNSQQSVHSMQSQDTYAGNNVVMSQNASFMDYQQNEEPPRKRMRPTPDHAFSQTTYDGAIDPMVGGHGSPMEVNQFYAPPSQSYMAPQPFTFGLEPLSHPSGELEEQRKELLLDLFMDPSRTDFDDHPAFLTMSGEEFEMPIDNSCNTALHWAATLARIPLVQKLVDKGFNVRRANSGGETALIAACQARNNLDQSTFAALLDLLGSSIEVRDGRGRTMLHHIAVSSAMKGRSAVGKYYLDSLLGYVLRQSNAGQATAMSIDGAQPSAMTLTRFMSEIVNAQDKSGDTALNLAARTSTRTIIDQLLEVGADPHIANRGALAPVDFGVGIEDGHVPRDPAIAPVFDTAHGVPASQQSIEEAKEGFMTSMSGIFTQAQNDFENEVKEKDEILSKTNAALKEASASLLDERKQLEQLSLKARSKEELEQKVKNLKRFNEDLRTQLAAKATVQEAISIGEADKGLDLDGKIEKITELFPNGAEDLGGTLNQDQITLITSLERAEVLEGRVRAYQTHNALLNNEAKGLKGRSKDLEEKYRKIISLCTKTAEEHLDEQMVDHLLQAVVSEQKDSSGTDVTRMRDFLRMVHTNQ